MFKAFALEGLYGGMLLGVKQLFGRPGEIPVVWVSDVEPDPAALEAGDDRLPIMPVDIPFGDEGVLNGVAAGDNFT